MTDSPNERAYTPLGLAAVAGTALAWGAGIVFIKLTTSPFLVVAFYRHALALPWLVLAWVVVGRQRLPWVTAGVGGALFAVHQVFHFSSLRYTTAAVVTILLALQPIVIALTGRWVTRERGSARFYAWSAVAAAGCGVLVGASAASLSLVGTLLAVGNLFAFTAYYLATKRARDRTSTAAYMVVMTTTSGIIITALALGAGQSLASPSGREWLWLALIGIVPATIGHMLITWAHPRVHAAASSSVNLGMPVVATLGTWLFVGEPFGWIQGAGAMVALGAAGVAMRHLPPVVLSEAAKRYGEAAT